MTTATAEASEKARPSRRRNPSAARRSGSKKGKMTDTHRKALAEGREQARVVREYLAALDERRPRRGRKVSVESLQRRLDKVTQAINISETSAAKRLALLQEQMDLKDRIESLGQTDDFPELQKRFVKVAKPWAERKHISRAAFREFGVPADVLKEAGIA